MPTMNSTSGAFIWRNELTGLPATPTPAIAGRKALQGTPRPHRDGAAYGDPLHPGALKWLS